MLTPFFDVQVAVGVGALAAPLLASGQTLAGRYTVPRTSAVQERVVHVAVGVDRGVHALGGEAAGST